MLPDPNFEAAPGETMPYARPLWHPAIIQALAAGWDLTIGHLSLHKDVAPRANVVREDDSGVSWEAFVGMGAVVIWLRVRVHRGDPRMQFWAVPVYGHTGVSQPLIQRAHIPVRHTMADGGEPTYIADLDVPDNKISEAINGQPMALQYWCINFTQSDAVRMIEDVVQSDPLAVTDYAPKDATHTGMHHAYGIRHFFDSDCPSLAECDFVIEDLAVWRHRLYPVAKYPSVWIDLSSGLVQESDHPKLAGREHFFRGLGEHHWIRYTDDRHPWKDEPAGGVRSPDDQHFVHYNPPAEAFVHFKAHGIIDEGFAMLTLIGAQRFMFQFPGSDKGFWRWDPGSGRARGRLCLAADDLIEALAAMGEDDLAFAIGKRIWQRLQNQVAEWRSKLDHGFLPFPRFGRSGAYSPAELGIYWYGLNQITKRIRDLGIATDEFDFMLRELAAYVFESWMWWDEEGKVWSRTRQPGRGKFDVPYSRTEDGAPIGGPSSMDPFCWAAAVAHAPETAEDVAKMAELNEMRERIPRRFWA